MTSAPTMSSTLIDASTIKKSSLIIRSLNHKLRQAIIDLIAENQKMTVTEIYVKLRIEQSVASQHLAILRRANMVKTVRDGKFIYYSLNADYINHVNRLAAELIH